MTRAWFLCLAACADPLLPCSDRYVTDGRADVTSYRVEPTSRTSGGMLVDDPRGELDADAAEALVQEAADCLGHDAWLCGLVVKVAPNWVTDGHGDAQFFPSRASPQTRGAVQHGNVLVVTPNQWTTRHEALHAISGEPGHPESVFRCDAPASF